MAEEFKYPAKFVEYYFKEWEGKDPTVANVQALIKNVITMEESKAIADHLRNGGEAPERPEPKKEEKKKEAPKPKKKKEEEPAPEPVPEPAKPIIKKVNPITVASNNGFSFIFDKTTGKVSRFTTEIVNRMVKKYPQRYERR